jgi:hypothetical protein
MIYRRRLGMQRRQGGRGKQASAAVAFRPWTDVANCTIWHEADTGITLDGSSKVQTWLNQASSNHNATQPTGALRPTMTTINGKPAVAFNGSTQFLSTSTPGTLYTTASGRTTAFVVWEHLTGTAILVPVHLQQAGQHEGYFYTGTTSNQGGYLHRVSNAVGTKLDGKRIVTGRNSAANLTAYSKTTLHATAAVAGASNGFTTFSYGCYGSSSAFFGGSIAVVGVFDRELTNAEFTAIVDTYLSPKYGI